MEIKVIKESEEGKEKKYGKFDDWEIDCAVDALIRAEEIKNDSEKMKYVEPLLKEKLEKTKKAISSLTGLKAAAKERIKEIEEKEEY